jgi:hypothetical protein
MADHQHGVVVASVVVEVVEILDVAAADGRGFVQAEGAKTVVGAPVPPGVA